MLEKRQINFTADEIVRILLNLAPEFGLCLLDSGGVSYLDSHLLIAGISPIETLEIKEENALQSLDILNRKLSSTNLAAFLTISYDFGLRLENIKPRPKEFPSSDEPDLFLALFDCLIIHDYKTQKTFLAGNEKRFDKLEDILLSTKKNANQLDEQLIEPAEVSSNFTRESYISTVEKIQDFIRRGDTYQTNLTQQFRARLPQTTTPEKIFRRSRENHPSPFSAFLRRGNSTVVSASPERFLQVKSQESRVESLVSSTDSRLQTPDSRLISVSPIKGTRRRGKTAEEDEILRHELLTSAKDRAENVMIVDLLRNDIGRVCRFGSVKVEKLCDLEVYPTLFHLVSTIRGELRDDVSFAELLRAVFPCGSITGAPKIRTMQIIDQLETAPRGLSMGAIGYSIPPSTFHIPSSKSFNSIDLNVAIRTMVIHNQEAVFNVGGGIVIDSDPAGEYEESLLKARALLGAINGELTPAT